MDYTVMDFEIKFAEAWKSTKPLTGKQALAYVVFTLKII